jgi:hypothetical protein
MGCMQSSEHNQSNNSHINNNNANNLNIIVKNTSLSACCFDEQYQNTNTTSIYDTTINSIEVDLSHFSRPREVLGIGGFGLVRKVTKLTGSDQTTCYALKSINKGMILSRQSGITAVMTELKTLILVDDCDFICRLHYAFQDIHQLYMITDYASGGDLRYNLRKASNYRFSERLSKVFILQTFIALDFCHSRNILHRGKGNSCF